MIKEVKEILTGKWQLRPQGNALILWIEYETHIVHTEIINGAHPIQGRRSSDVWTNGWRKARPDELTKISLKMPGHPSAEEIIKDDDPAFENIDKDWKDKVERDLNEANRRMGNRGNVFRGGPFDDY